jgi:ADP-ribose pyrophosphatase
MSDAIKPVFNGRIVQLTLDQVTLPNGHVTELEVIHHPGGAAVVALDDRQQVCLLRQYRHVTGGWLWELPAGKLDNQEPPLQAAHRELREEAGIDAGDWLSLSTMHSSPGVFTEVVHLFLARNLTQVGHQQQPSEVIEIHWLPFQQAIAMALQGDISDAKTVIGLLRAQAILSD